MNRYIPHTEEDVKVMLEKIGVNSTDDLFSDIPEDVILKGKFVGWGDDSVHKSAYQSNMGSHFQSLDTMERLGL